MKLEKDFIREKLKDKKPELDIKVVEENNSSMEFDLIGVDSSLANSFRRTILSDLPTMAIENVFIKKNSSVIPDEILAHRLGLVPIKADPRLFCFKTKESKQSEQNTIVFKLKAHCLSEELSVYSKEIVWVQPKERTDLPADSVSVLYSDVLLLKLAKNQEVELEMHCVKGTGREHIKWSPVGTVFYRFHPKIVILQKVSGKDAYRLQKCFSPGVIDVVNDVAVVSNERVDSLGRELFKHKDLSDKVSFSLLESHIIFKIESTSFYTPRQTFEEALKLFLEKCTCLKRNIEKL